MKLTYLASPYSNSDIHTVLNRYDAAVDVAAELKDHGMIVYSPIAHTHVMATKRNLPTSWEYWEKDCRAFLEASERLIVLKLDGWEQSVGVAAEIRLAEEMGIPVSYMEYVR